MAAAGSLAVTPSIDRYGRRLQRLSAALGIASLAEALAIVVVGSSGEPQFHLELNLFSVGALGTVVLSPVMGALIVQRRPMTRVAWLLIALGLGLGFGALTAGYGLVGQAPTVSYSGRSLPLAMAALLISQFFFVPTFGSLTVFILLLFPTDRFLGPRWRLAGWIGAFGSFLYVIGAIFKPGAIDSENLPGLVNPIGALPELAPALTALSVVGSTLAAVGMVAGTASLIVRYRRADSVEAAQIRWVALVAAFAAGSLLISALLSGAVGDLAFGLGFTFLACMPIAIGIAITRYRLYDIDRLINRALVYGALTAILAGVFTAAIGLGQRLFVALTNQSSDAAIVGATLIVATLYAPLRKRLEALVDRRFKYEAREFGAYRAELESYLRLIEPEEASQRLAAEAMRELGAAGAAVTGRSEEVVASAGTWPQPASIRVPIGRAETFHGTLVVGPRTDGKARDPHDVEKLAELAMLVGAAIRRG